MHKGKRQQGGWDKRVGGSVACYSTFVFPCLKTRPLQSCSRQIQTHIEDNLPWSLHNSVFLMKKYNAGFFFRQNLTKFYQRNRLFYNIWVTVQLRERFSGFSVQEMRRRRGGSGFKMLSGFVHCEFNVCENWNTFMPLRGSIGLLKPRRNPCSQTSSIMG